MGLNVAGADVIEVRIILDVINVICMIGFIRSADVIKVWMILESLIPNITQLVLKIL